ncbi:hypothetical protein NBRC116188_10970 [Oceaniserpentilla sp. 4NH20-0058]|uniref:ATP-binding protein n=1 Tax=Oceaniserpentilla sp. 4NH20-0058 TaxID=3127660 RepID=UPI0031044BB2
MPNSRTLLLKAANAMDLKWAYVDTNLIYRQVSSQYCKWHKTDENRVLGRKVAQVVSTGTALRLLPYWEQALEGHEVSFETQLIRVGGDQISYVQATFIPDFHQNQVIGFYVFYLDHTDDKKAIATLEKLHEITSDGALNLDEKVMKILDLGTKVFDLPIAIVSEIIHERYIVKYAISPENAIKPSTEFELGATYCIHTLAANGPLAFHHTGESEINKHPCYQNFGLESYIGIPITVNNVRYGTLNFSSSNIREKPFNDYDFSLIRLLSQWIGNELSRYESNHSLSFQKTLLESMSQQARIGTWELDFIDKKLYWSDMTREILEVESDYQPGLETTFNFYKEGTSRDSVREAINTSIKTGQKWDLDVQIITASNRCIWVNAMGQAEFNGNKCVRLYGSFQDIDSRVKTHIELARAKQEAEQATQAKGEFLANMSHEIRTPMNGVLGMLKSVLNTNMDEEQSYRLQLAYKSAESLLFLINDILDFSKVDAGKLEIHEHDFNLKLFIEDFQLSMRPSIESKGLEFEVDTQGIEIEFVLGDEHRIKQILINLVGNALKFTHQGSIRLIIESKLSDQNIQCVFRVQDTGIGIESKKLNHLFEVFTQADNSTTRKYGGTGLGLAITKQLCELMGGRILAVSTLNQGSEFCVTLNLKQSTKKQSLKSNLNIQSSQELRDFHSQRVLLVEDNLINQEVAKDQLSDLSLLVEIADNGRKALEKLNNHPDGYFHLVLMDCQMPEMDGYQATKAIRNGEAGSFNASLPIIAMTANAMKGDRDTCIAAGMSEYLSKPISVQELQAMIALYLESDPL